jgi:ligand-binding sensor domain-containing protein
MKRLLGLTLLLICLWAGAETAIPNMKFRRLDTRDGLSNSTINCIYQDSKGYIWIGTSYGLNRYDGYRFRTFYSDPNDTTTLRSNYVDQIFEDASGRLWLRQGMNYSLFDPKTERTERNPSRQLAAYGVHGGIDRFYIDSQRNIWVKTYDEGLYCNVAGRKKHTLTRYGYEDGLLPKEFYFSSMADWNGTLLVASSDGELIGVDPETGRVKWKDRYMIEHGGKMSEAYNIVVDTEGNYWVMTNLKTFVYDQKAKRWHPSVNSFLEAHGIAPLPDPLQIWDVMADKRGWIWIGTDHEGVFVIDPKSKEVKQLLNDKTDATSLSDNTVRHLMTDRSGNVWISGYRNGLNQYIENLSGFRTLEMGDINTTTEDSDGNYWFGTDNRGVIKYMPQTGETEVYDKARCGFASDIMVASHGAKDGSVWFGTYNGGLVQIANGRVKNYMAQNADGALLNNNVWSVTEDKWGDIWIGTLGSGVQKLQTKTGKFLAWNSYNGKMPENFMTSASWTRKGWLLVGHSNYYSMINPVSGKVMNFTIPAVPGQPVAVANTVCVVEDSRQLIWQGSTAGCCIFDPKTGQQKLLDMNSGLLGSSVVGIEEDLLHTMWVVTEHGISNVVPKKEDNGEWSFLVRSFSSKDGLQQGPYNQRSVSRTHDGLILVGGLGGVDVINPKLITNVNNDERPMFSGLKLFGQQMGVGQAYEGRVILEKALDELKELVLRYDENQFTIQLATNKGEIHNPSRFIYQLEGFSDKWMKTEENDPNITYMSLRHGNYILHVRMLNDDGTMGTEEATLKLTITPPLLRNRWLMLFFLACVAGGIWFWRRRFLIRQEDQVERERLRVEVMKKQWMNEIKTQMMNQQEQEKPKVTSPEWEITSLNRQPGDLQEFMKDECAKFTVPEGKKLKFSFFPLANDLVVDFDREMLGQAVQILLNNSVMFSPTNCVIKVFVDKTQSEGTIRISDNGIGLPEEAKEHMFDPVVSDDDPGVCLSIVKDIVTAHGGTVKGDNNAGGGSVFTISLPLQREEEVEEAVIME